MSSGSGEDSYDYSKESEESSESTTARERRRKKDKKVAKKDKDKKEKGKKEKKKPIKEKKTKKKVHKKERKRKRSPSSSYSYSASCSGSSSSGRRRDGKASRRRSHRRGRSPPRGYAAMPAYRGSHELPPLNLPTDGSLTIEQACEAAGRGVTSSNTVLDEDITVRSPDESVIDNPDTFDTFDEIKDFPREIRSALKDAGFPGPSQIQAYCWPLGNRGKDIIGIAATGSGKTLAFLLPAFSYMLDENHRPERDGPGLLVLSPTRELAQQIEVEASRFGRAIGVRCVAMYGGAPKGDQMSKYRQGVHTIVACPGRLNDFLEGGQVRLQGVAKLVLDEADRMLDMGFEPQIRKILEKVPRKRQTMFFTATWPKEVRQLAGEILTRPYQVMIGNRDQLKGNQDITQLCRMCDAPFKNQAMSNLLHEAGLTRPSSAGKVLVFCNTKRMCEQLSQMLLRSGFPAASIHGDKDQRQRDEALEGLKSGRIKILCATDVAARGLDIKGVGLVVNYDPANNTEDYVHRIGRTARAGAKGFAVTFLSQADAGKARGIMEVMERTDQFVDPQLRALAECGDGGGGRNRGGRGRNRKGGGKGDDVGGGFPPPRARSRSRSASRWGGTSPMRSPSASL